MADLHQTNVEIFSLLALLLCLPIANYEYEITSGRMSLLYLYRYGELERIELCIPEQAAFCQSEAIFEVQY